MSNNINISSGSRSFQNKIFGSITKLTKPSFAYEGKIFSDTAFNNQKIIPYYKNSRYYIAHGLPDDFSLLDPTIIPFGSDLEAQTIETSFGILVDPSQQNPVALKSILSSIQSLSSVKNGANLEGPPFADPYDDNNNQCTPI